MDFVAMLNKVLIKNGLIFAFVIIGITNLIAYKFAGLTKGRIHGSAVAIFFGLVYWLTLVEDQKDWHQFPYLQGLAC